MIGGDYLKYINNNNKTTKQWGTEVNPEFSEDETQMSNKEVVSV